ncbi:MAG: c-type cytochrome [Candidatus Eisenbacteria bacterium]|nr:c-type cytochrome [Candidatus Eisenbacteria bacterium]
MRWNRIIPAALVAGALVIALVTLGASAPARSAAGKPAADRRARIEHGEYLATTMGCNDCHTPGTLYGAPDFSRRLSGSELGWQGPWGVSYARNLTPDPETGIGKWSEQDIVNALRTGLRPDGTMLLPPMPWQNSTRMTEQDIHALAAYLKSIPAVRHRVPDRLPPGQTPTGSFMAFPPPSVWDSPRTAPAGAPGAGEGDAKSR